MNKLFNTAFEIILSITILVTIIVAISHTLDKLSDSLLLLWEICGISLAVSFIFLVIFKDCNKLNK